MKRITLITIMCLTACLKALSVEVEVDGIKYVANIEDKSAKVIRKDNKYEGSIVIPSSINVDGVVYHVTSIGEYAFSQCSNLISVTMPEGITTIEKDAFAACNHLSPVVIPSTVTSIGSDAFNGCSSFTSLTIPSSVKSIGNRAFRDCFHLTSITIPEGVTDIGHSAFIYCTGLSSVTIPSSVVHFGGVTFRGCSNLTSITIAEGATIIGEGDFAECFALASITIPSSVTTIGQGAFLECHSLADVYCKAEKVPATGADVFDDIESLTLHVPASAIEDYKSTEPWSLFGTIVALDPPGYTYHPFVEAGKRWCVHGFNMGMAHRVIDYYFTNDEETIDGKTYLPMYEKEGEQTTLVGLFREEDHRVYLYNKDAGRECLTYDFSLQEDDEFTPEYGDFSHGKVTKVSYKEVNGEQLKVLTIATSNGTDVEWIEGVGVNAAFGPSPLEGMYSIHEPNSWGYHTAYVLYDNSLEPNFYLPFSFGLNYNGWWGQQPQTDRVEAEDKNSGLGLHYILLPDPEHDCYALHVYGDIIWSNSPNRYVYCVEDKSTHTLKLQFEELEPSVGGTGRYHINLSFPFFLSGNRYVVVDEQGEHAVPVWQEPSDDYRPFIEEGKVWKVGHTGDYPGWFDKAMALEYFYFDGDTIVGDRQCKKMMRREEYANHETRTTFVGALYEDNRRVFYARPNGIDFAILYDFGSLFGTIFDYYATETGTMMKGYIKERKVCEDETFHGWTSIITYYDNQSQIFLDYDPVNVIWREGVGFKGLYNNQEAFLEGGARELMSCTVGDEVLYYDPSLIDGVTPEDSEVKKNTIDFTHTVKTRPKAPRRGAVSESGDDEPLTGEYSLKELFVNFKPLAGPYVITICNDSGTEVYRKEVQTSNVVGLNTDISGYEKGEYTITVENDEEAYTAELKIDEKTGIKRPTPDPSRDGGEKAGAMYDLSGRRIANNSSARQLVHSSTLPKGIYIKDGRKVVVK